MEQVIKTVESFYNSYSSEVFLGIIVVAFVTVLGFVVHFAKKRMIELEQVAEMWRLESNRIYDILAKERRVTTEANKKLETEKNELTLSWERYKKQLSGIQECHSKEKKELVERYERRIDKLEKDFVEHTQTWKNKVKEAEKRTHIFVLEAAEVKNEHEKLSQTYSEHLKQVHVLQEENEKLKEEVKKSLIEAKDYLDLYELENDRCRSILQEKTNRESQIIEELKQQLKDLGQACEKLADDYLELCNKPKQQNPSEEEYNGLLCEQVKNLETQLQKAMEEKGELSDEIREREDDIHTLEHELKELEKSVSNWTEVAKTWEQCYESSDEQIEKLSDENEKLQKQNRSLSTIIQNFPSIEKFENDLEFKSHQMVEWRKRYYQLANVITDANNLMLISRRVVTPSWIETLGEILKAGNSLIEEERIDSLFFHPAAAKTPEPSSDSVSQTPASEPSPESKLQTQVEQAMNHLKTIFSDIQFRVDRNQQG